MFELCGYDILLRLGRQRRELARGQASAVTRLVEVLCQLLGNGTAAALLLLAHQYGLEAGARRSLEVDARVVEEAYILRSHQRRHDRRQGMAVDVEYERVVLGKKLVVREVRAVLYEIRAEHLAVGRVELRGKIGLRILQLLERGHGAEHLELGQREQQHGHEYAQRRERPHRNDDMSLRYAPQTRRGSSGRTLFLLFVHSGFIISSLQ